MSDVRTTVHRQVTVYNDGKAIEVDEALAGLLSLLWRLGIRTVASCQNADEFDASSPHQCHSEDCCPPPRGEPTAYIVFDSGFSLDIFTKLFAKDFDVHDWKFEANFDDQLYLQVEFPLACVPRMLDILLDATGVWKIRKVPLDETLWSTRDDRMALTRDLGYMDLQELTELGAQCLAAADARRSSASPPPAS